MKLKFEPLAIPTIYDQEPRFSDWHWQMQKSLRTEADFSQLFELTPEERAGFAGLGELFEVRTTPYYASLALGPNAVLAAARTDRAQTLASGGQNPHDPIRKILMPNAQELVAGAQQMLDPLGEKRNSPAPRVIHRYPDRALLLVTDTCSVYCRYCTRKHFTASEQNVIRTSEYDQALSYFKRTTGLREVILSGGDPLTLADSVLKQVLSDLRSIEHIEIIRIGTRMPVVCPMRITPELVKMLSHYQPVYMMTHFNHPRELTAEAASALTLMANAGLPLFNQMVLLNGVNNSPEIVAALSRRLMYLRVKPYYMFQCDPSLGTDHLRTSIEDSLEIQRELWGRLSGLAMPQLSVDIPDGGGKAGLVPNFQVAHEGQVRKFKGWDNVFAEYVSPLPAQIIKPIDSENYRAEWEELKAAKKQERGLN